VVVSGNDVYFITIAPGNAFVFSGTSTVARDNKAHYASGLPSVPSGTTYYVSAGSDYELTNNSW